MLHYGSASAVYMQRKPWGEMVDRSAFARPANLAEVRPLLLIRAGHASCALHRKVLSWALQRVVLMEMSCWVTHIG